MILKVTVLLLCGMGLYASSFMQRKSLRAEHGKLKGPSVVKSPRARLIGGVPNSFFGLLYYALLALAIPLLGWPPAWYAALLAAAMAAALSLYLAYSLLFVTKRSCPYCWTSHLVNWSLVGLLLALRP